MKSILLGAICAAIIAIGAYAVLDTGLQRTVEERFTTEGVRL
jgi:ABC-type proline/glycine betaine transport system permease subunit